MEPLKIRWKTFFNAMFDPWNISLVVFCIVFFILSVSQTSILLSSLAFILITITSAFLGSRVTKMSETNIIKSRGHSAVRSLKLLLRSIITLSERIKKFHKENSATKISPEVTMRNYEEAIVSCGILQEQVVNSIENWTDIVPEADFKTQIGEISKISNELDEKGKELSELKNELNDEKGKNEKERELLKKQIHEKEDKIRSLNNKLLESEYGLGISQTSRYINPHLFGSVPVQLPSIMSRLRTMNLFPTLAGIASSTSRDNPEEEEGLELAPKKSIKKKKEDSE